MLYDYELHVSYDELRVLVFALDQGQRVYQQRSRQGRLKKILTYNLNLTLAMQKKLEPSRKMTAFAVNPRYDGTWI